MKYIKFLRKLAINKGDIIEANVYGKILTNNNLNSLDLMISNVVNKLELLELKGETDKYEEYKKELQILKSVKNNIIKLKISF